ncbi:CHAT domain-containing protein [Calidifontibacter terrae]
MDESAELEPERWRARWHFQRAGVLGRAGDVPAALDEMTTALAGLEQFDDLEQCAVLVTDGLLRAMAGSQRAAARSFGRARRLAETLGHAGMHATALHDEGYAEYLAGSLPRALELVSAGDVDDGFVTPAILLLDRGSVLLECGLIDDAREVLSAAATHVRPRRPDHTAAEIQLELARALRLVGDPEAAARHAGRARRLYARIGATAWEERARLLQVTLSLDDGQGSTARTAELAALWASARHRGDVDLADQVAVAAARAALEAGDAPAADEWLARSRPSAGPPGAAALQRTWVLARVRAVQGEPGRARRVLADAARQFGRARAGTASLDLRTAAAVHAVRLGRLDLDLALNSGASAVLASLDRWRSATDRLPAVRPSPDRELREATERLRTLADRAREETDPRELSDLARRRDALQRQVRARTWALTTEGGGSSTPDVRRARAVLAEQDRDLIWFARHRGRLLGVGVMRGRARLVDLGPADEVAELSRRLSADLLVASTQRLGGLRGAVLASLRDGSAQLGRLLLAPWSFGAGGVVVVAGSDLAGLPWSLLPGLRGRPVTVARSLTGWASRAGATPVRPRVSVCVGPRLPRATEEAAAVRDAWGGAHVAPSATSDDLIAAATGADIVHVAAHGTHRPDSPLFSSVELTGGPVFAHEFQPAGVSARHVVLSACEVGAAAVRPGDETLGLASSLWSLGAVSLVAAPRPVLDEVAADVMARHHRHLAAGCPVDESLARAIDGADVSAASFLALGSAARFLPR